MRKREAIQPRNYKERKPMQSSLQQAEMRNRYARERRFRRVRERGEHTKVVHVYLGGLAVSEQGVFMNGKGKRSLANGVSLTGCQKSDYPIVAVKCVKACGAKGITNQRILATKHV